MPLTETRLRALKPKDKPYKVADDRGLYIEVSPSGGKLWRFQDYTGNFITRYALLIAPHVFVRPGELRHADWKEIDLEEGVWRIPEGKMKARRPHAVPLSKQVVGYLKELAEMVGTEGYVFPSARASVRPMSENTLNAAFRRMGFTKEEVTAHGLRATASTMLNESGLWNPDAIERGLAHGDSNAVRGVYPPAHQDFRCERIRGEWALP